MKKLIFHKLFFMPFLGAIAPVGILNLMSHEGNTVLQTTEPSFADKIATNTVTNLYNEPTSHLTISTPDTKSQANQNVILPVNDLTYKESDLQNLKDQVAGSCDLIDATNVQEYIDLFNAKSSPYSKVLRISSIQPRLEGVSFDNQDKYKSSTKATQTLAAPAHKYTAQVLHGIIWIPEERFEKAKYWNEYQWADYRLFSSSIYGAGWTPWTPYDKNLKLVNLIGKSYDKIAYRIKGSNFELQADLPSATQGHQVYIPNSFKDLGNNEIEFVVGDKGNEHAIVTGYKSSYRYDFRILFTIRAQYINKLELDNHINILNGNYSTPQSRLEDINFSYLDARNLNAYAAMQSASRFESERRQVYNELEQLRTNNYYNPIIKQYLAKEGVRLSNEGVQLSQHVINQHYQIKQYNYKIDTELKGTHRNYQVSNNQISKIYKYSGIGNLIADAIVLDETSGVKTKLKLNGGVYDGSDASQLALKFKPDNKLFRALNWIDQYNKLILEVKDIASKKSIDFAKAVLPLWRFSFDIDAYKGNIDELITSLLSWDNAMPNQKFESLRNLLFDTGNVTAQKLQFFHDLPRLVNEYFSQMQINLSVSQANQLPTNFVLFKNNQFNPIGFDDALLNKNIWNVSNNLANMTIHNLSIQNLKYPLESIKSVDMRRVSREYKIGDSMRVDRNYLKYEVLYRKDYQNFKPIENRFAISKNIDFIGYSASDYANKTVLTDQMKRNIKVAIQNNFKGKNSDLAIPESDIQVINQNLLNQTGNSQIQKVIELKNKYQLNFDADDSSGNFYVLISIQNSNDLNKIGSEFDSEIIKNHMWFVEQNKLNPLTRMYLVKVKAAKQKIDPIQIKFATNQDTKTVKMIFENSNDEINSSFDLEIKKNIYGKYLKQQEIMFNPNQYYVINQNANESQIDALKIRFQNALSELGIITNSDSLIFNFANNKIIFDAYEVADSQIAIHLSKSTTSTNTIDLYYSINDVKDNKPKYSITYELNFANGKPEIKFHSNNQFTNAINHIYLEPYKQEIFSYIKNVINTDEQIVNSEYWIDGIYIDFITMETQTFVVPKNPNVSNNQNTSTQNIIQDYHLGIILGITIPLAILLIVVPCVIVHKKKHKKIA